MATKPRKTRRLKVGISSYPRACMERPPQPPSPYLRLRGYWLEQAGIHAGQQVQVRITGRSLTITALPDS